VALSALSSSHRAGYCALDALQHYQQALPTLQTSLDDLQSDGTLFTHFLLLIYEIIAAEQWREGMWQQHLTQLLCILQTRMDGRRKERLPYLLWWLVIIDTYAALTAEGNGELVNKLLEKGCMPDPTDITAPLAPIEAPEILTLFEEVLGLAQKVFVHASKLGQLSHKMRDPKAPAAIDAVVYGERECYQIVYQLKNVWQTEQPRVEDMITSVAISGASSASVAAGSPVLPAIQETYEHVGVSTNPLYRSCDVSLIHRPLPRLAPFITLRLFSVTRRYSRFSVPHSPLRGSRRFKRQSRPSYHRLLFWTAGRPLHPVAIS
jgi:hypothetical protein